MTDFQQLISDGMLWIEGLTMVISLFYYNRLKGYWKYFVFYLIIIFLFEAFGKWGGEFITYNKSQWYNYIVMPVEFIFFYWLYAAKSLERTRLFVILSFLYMLSYIPSELFFSKSKIVYSFNYTFGCLILMVLVVMEYYKQINSSDILNFDKNRMFYINLGVTLFYIGTLPFLTFYSLLREHLEIWNIYFNYFLISGVLMYLLFSISFIWGKQSS